jgi:hypothetical protein
MRRTAIPLHGRATWDPHLLYRGIRQGCYPNTVVGWITHHRTDVGVLKAILPATFSDLYDSGQVNTKPPRASTGA